MKYSKLPRLYCKSHLEKDMILSLYEEEVNYIKNVLRLKDGFEIRIFNENSGEYFGQVFFQKKEVNVKVGEIFRKKEELEKEITLYLSIIKQDKFELVCDMATQLGVKKIIPLITSRVQRKEINNERLEKIILAAVKQSERLTIPELAEPIGLDDLRNHDHEVLFFANELEDHDLVCNIDKYNDIGIIIGPEGGFTDEEVSNLLKFKNIKSISLGKNILRAETAAIALLSKVSI